MILRKPYAFLIKYFRVINLLLAILLFWCLRKTNLIVNFFNSYVRSGYRTSVVVGLSKQYTPISIFIYVFIVIIINIILIALMRKKEKPTTLYIAMMLYYSLVFAGLFFISSVLSNFETELLEAASARGIRDIITILNFPAYAFIFLAIVRAVGFDLKKFDFGDDIKEMNLSSKDAEEFELNINIDFNKYLAVIRHSLREFVYSIRENIFIYSVILGIVIIIFIVTAIANRHINFNRTFKEGKEFEYKNLKVTVDGTITSNLDYKGNLIKDDIDYLIAKLTIENPTSKSIDIDYNSFKLLIGDNQVSPTMTDTFYFIDYAASTAPKVFFSNMKKTFSIVYKLDKNQIKKIDKMQIYNGTKSQRDGTMEDTFIYVNINPQEYYNLHIVGNYKQNEEVKFLNTFLGETSIELSDYTIGKNYLFKYDKCNSKGICKSYDDIITVPVTDNRQDNLIIAFDAKYIQAEGIGYADSYNTLNGFAENFMTIQYRSNGETYSNLSRSITPATTSNFVAFEVPKNIVDADVIQVIITIREKQYIINIDVSKQNSDKK